MDIKVIVALIGITGILLSAFVQYFLGSKSELRKKSIELRAQSYVDLIDAVAAIASTKSRSQEQLEKLNQSKTRVVLMGSDEVVLAVEAFWSEHGTLSSSSSHAAFSKIINAMRADLNGQSSVALDVLQRSLFGGSNA